jgi:hypothetical protein
VPRRGSPGKPRTQDLTSDLARRFYADIEAAQPFSGLPAGPCMKSASFGSTLKIEYAGQETPDLSCGDRGNERLRLLIQDCDKVTEAFAGK